MITFEEYENALKQRHGERIHNILSHSSVAIAGLGGLGSNIAMYLATGIRCNDMILLNIKSIIYLNYVYSVTK